MRIFYLTILCVSTSICVKGCSCSPPHDAEEDAFHLSYMGMEVSYGNVTHSMKGFCSGGGLGIRRNMLTVVLCVESTGSHHHLSAHELVRHDRWCHTSW